MFKLATSVALLLSTTLGDLLDLGEETGEIMMFSNAATGFNNWEELNGNLDNLECFIKNTYFDTCKTELTKRIRSFEDAVEKPIIVGYFIDEIYNHDDLFVFKQNFGMEKYKYVEILGLSIEQGSQFYHRLNKVLRQRRYRQYPNDYDDFTETYAQNKQLIMFDVDTVANALTLSQKVNEYIAAKRPEANVISIVAPSKAEMDEYTIQRRLLSVTYNYSVCESAEYGNYCLSYYCNRSFWDTQAYSDSCIDSYDLFGILLLVLLFLPFCCIGCCCIDGIQTPLRFPTRVLPVGKEF